MLTDLLKVAFPFILRWKGLCYGELTCQFEAKGVWWQSGVNRADMTFLPCPSAILLT